MDVGDEIVRAFRERGEQMYHGEPVSQAEHALQAAHRAAVEGAPDELVVAALLHDVGHLLGDLPEDVAEAGIDARHEESGAAWLSDRFGPSVVGPVQMHVDAKRYLCAVDPAYLSVVSPASRRSLDLQGGPMSGEEVAEFEARPHSREAIRLRRWDDAAKEPGRDVPGLVHYLPLVTRVAGRCHAEEAPR